MKEIINQLIESEREAGGIITKAKSDAAEINLDTEKEVARINEQEIKKANQEAREIVQSSKTKAESKTQRVLSELSTEIQTSFKDRESLIPELVKEIITKITTVTP